MKELVQNLIRKYSALAKFLLVGGVASAIHAAISWAFYYHILCGYTILSTLAGYSGGWIASYLGNRLWSFRYAAKETSVVGSASRFVLNQLVCMCVLLGSTWLVQKLIILYFYWYIITNNISPSAELDQFSAGASYPPALLAGMAAAAICSFFIMKFYVFQKRDSHTV